jgi:hypothetical protein
MSTDLLTPIASGRPVPVLGLPGVGSVRSVCIYNDLDEIVASERIVEVLQHSGIDGPKGAARAVLHAVGERAAVPSRLSVPKDVAMIVVPPGCNCESVVDDPNYRRLQPPWHALRRRSVTKSGDGQKEPVRSEPPRRVLGTLESAHSRPIQPGKCGLIAQRHH